MHVLFFNVYYRVDFVIIKFARLPMHHLLKHIEDLGKERFIQGLERIVEENWQIRTWKAARRPPASETLIDLCRICSTATYFMSPILPNKSLLFFFVTDWWSVIIRKLPDREGNKMLNVIKLKSREAQKISCLAPLRNNLIFSDQVIKALIVKKAERILPRFRLKLRI